MTRQEAIALVREVSNYMATRPEIDEAIDMAIDALEKEPKRGKWIIHPEGKFVGFPYVHYECSECRAFVPEDTEYCPRCGARMESDEE